jgi:hypothetical protein
MCFDAATLDAIGWSSVGLAEDVELHLTLVRSGIRVDFAPEAVVQADMPTTSADAASQNLRWEAGRIAVLRREVPGMLLQGLRRRDAIIVDAAIEQIIPPLSVAFAAGVLSMTAGAIAGSAPIVALGFLGTTAIAGHIVAGLIALRAQRARTSRSPGHPRTSRGSSSYMRGRRSRPQRRVGSARDGSPRNSDGADPHRRSPQRY